MAMMISNPARGRVAVLASRARSAFDEHRSRAEKVDVGFDARELELVRLLARAPVRRVHDEGKFLIRRTDFRVLGAQTLDQRSTFVVSHSPGGFALATIFIARLAFETFRARSLAIKLHQIPRHSTVVFLRERAVARSLSRAARRRRLRRESPRARFPAPNPSPRRLFAPSTSLPVPASPPCVALAPPASPRRPRARSPPRSPPTRLRSSSGTRARRPASSRAFAARSRTSVVPPFARPASRAFAPAFASRAPSRPPPRRASLRTRPLSRSNRASSVVRLAVHRRLEMTLCIPDDAARTTNPRLS